VKTIHAKTSNREYDICIGKGIFKKSLKIIQSSFKKYNRVIVVTNTNILKLYKDFMDSFIIKPFHADLIVFDDGEKYKTLDSVEKIYAELYRLKASRDDILIALGGGVIGDMAGFAAATYNRGLKLIHIPTTIISQIDSSIGGKVVVNYKTTKNLIGCFYQPHTVIADLDFLSTLDDVQILNGLGEVIKYGLLFDKEILDDIIAYSKKKIVLHEFVQSIIFEKISYKCATIKTKVVQKDEYDLDYRNLLNFGHTIGHALESESKLKSSQHGIFVALGILCALDISILLGFLNKEIKDYIVQIYTLLGLPVSITDVNIVNIIEAMSFDKKISAGRNKFILLEDINKPIFYYDIDGKIIKESIIKNMR
jgi:3-dehydroquinate synthase